MNELLKQNISNHVTFSEEELQEFGKYFQLKTFKKKEYLLKQGDVCRFEGFVVSGCFRIFTFDQKGNDNTLYFAARDWWLMDNDSFMHQNPSSLNMQALEDSEVLMINRMDKLMLYEKLPIVEKLFRIMSQKALVAWQRRLIRNHCETAKERYQNFITTYPSIASKIKDKQMASYLGITHEFLSKIKKR
ncbi:Crp/Fnr family transcriptional regulator [Flammeovirga aprica]|nr:Crp/Fnr family transcriptional regulator [Flammeovirga aprica]